LHVGERTAVYDARNDPWVEIARYQTESDADQHALVLVAAGIECGIVRRVRGTGLLVSAANAAIAVSELAAYDRLNRPVPPPVVVPQSLRTGLGGTIAYACALLFMHGAATRHLFDREWVTAGAAQAGSIVGGEWWRVFTALGLHADYGHLFSNIAAGGLFGLFVAQVLGGGLTWLAILLAGGMGNAINAALQPAAHTAIGASTAVFGAVGILSVLLLQYQQSLWRFGLRRWLPLAVGVMILAFIGMEGERIDIGAHAAGFASGCLIGVGLSVIGPGLARRRDIQFASWAAAAVLMAGAWALALTAGGT
jgi:membrane associated rhomboid family serine protease